jgi:hypothetical protein
MKRTKRTKTTNGSTRTKRAARRATRPPVTVTIPAPILPAPERTPQQIRHDAAVKAAATKRLRAGLPPLTTAPTTAPTKGAPVPLKPSRRKAPTTPAAPPSEADTSSR